MSEMVLYRKYRPQNFSEVVGQDHVTDILKNAIATNKIAHAYLFCGPKGSGKTTIARLLAKAINCEDKSSSEPCNKCSACKDITDNRAMDIVEIDAASHRGIDEIRELRDNVHFAPSKFKHKVFILDEAHQLTSGAANAFLKILEEAPSHAIFILATTEPQKMIPTIISRCQRFDFRKISVSEITKKLEKIVKQEKGKVEKEVLSVIASLAGGSMRDAESTLSQVLSFAPKDGAIRKEDVKSFLGIVEREVVSDFIDALLQDEAVEALDLLEKVLSQGTSPENFYSNLIYYLREMMVLKIISQKTSDTKSLTSSLLVKFTEEEVERIKKQVEPLSTNDIKKIIDSFFEAGERIKYSPLPQLPLEVAVAETTETLRKTQK
ncbi:MAG: DNA polymerase III subunit gamma/tau [Candidatus Pacebacteria bacterium]|nr:DNA polymerase III subunit gamma/tau [Candidatus Paceibacterota bacterium]